MNRGKIIVERTPRTGAEGSMGFGGGEILCLAAGTCFYNNLIREATKRNIELEEVEIEVNGKWDDSSPVANEIIIKPYIKSQGGEEPIDLLAQHVLEASSVANTVSHGAPVKLFED